MAKKKLELIKLDRKHKKILFIQKSSRISVFLKKYNKMFLLLSLVLSLTVLTIGIFLATSVISDSSKVVIKETSIYTDIDVADEDVTSSIDIMSDEMAKKMFLESSTFGKNGEAILVKTVSKSKYVINFYSDYTAIRTMKNGNSVIRINPVNGNYGIGTNGVTNSKAEVLDIRKTKVENYPFGIVTYYTDGSAEISGTDFNMYVRTSDDINNDYISLNKVTYMKEAKNVKDIKLEYFYDGSVNVIKNNTSYLVRSVNYLNINDSNVTFKHNNYATIYKNVKLDDGVSIDYYTDGGAIIISGNKKLSVRKSNSIVIKNNKIYEIVDSNYVSVSNNAGNVTYYTNGSAIVKNYNGKTIYVSDSSLVKNNSFKEYEKLTESRNIDGDKVLLFETIGIVENRVYKAIVHKDSIIFNSDGSFKEIANNNDVDTRKPIMITNNTNNVVKYRLVIDRSNKTTLDVRYIKYQLLVNGKYTGPFKLSDTYWNKDKVYNSLGVKGNNYVLIERILEPQETDKINVMFWVDYDTVPNSMQNKIFLGTLRLYAWQELDNL